MIPELSSNHCPQSSPIFQFSLPVQVQRSYRLLFSPTLSIIVLFNVSLPSLSLSHNLRHALSRSRSHPPKRSLILPFFSVHPLLLRASPSPRSLCFAIPLTFPGLSYLRAAFSAYVRPPFHPSSTRPLTLPRSFPFLPTIFVPRFSLSRPTARFISLLLSPFLPVSLSLSARRAGLCALCSTCHLELFPETRVDDCGW